MGISGTEELLFVEDTNSGRHFLVDSGAQRSSAGSSEQHLHPEPLYPVCDCCLNGRQLARILQ